MKAGFGTEEPMFGANLAESGNLRVKSFNSARAIRPAYANTTPKRETPSSLSPSANSVGNGRNPQDFGCNTVIIGVSLTDLRFEILVIVTQSKIKNQKFVPLLLIVNSFHWEK